MSTDSSSPGEVPIARAPSHVEAAVRSAQDYVRRALGAELDVSETSLAFVDHYLASTRDRAMSEEVLALLATALGAYFGEVVRRRYGGSWEASGMPARWSVRLEGLPVSLHPIAIAAEAIAVGEAPGFDAALVVPPELEVPLADALSRVPPVEEEYYYSFTGRFENLAYCVEILAEVAHQKAENAGKKPKN